MFKCVLAVNKGQAECESKKASGLPTEHQAPRLDTHPQILKFTHILKLLACFYRVYNKKSPRPMRMMRDNSLGIFLVLKSQIRPRRFILCRETIWSK